MSRYQSIDFSDARERAFNHISRLFNAQKIAPDGADSKYIEVWEVELEIDTTEETKCLNVRVLLTPEFPLQIPYIFIDKDELAGLNFPPNINSGGEICTFDRNTSVSNPETPEILVEECIRRAKIIIEHGYSDDHIDSYTSEFIAYWEGRYGEEEEVDTSILFLIDEFGGPPEQVTYVILKKKLGKFHSLVFSSEKNFEVIKVFLDRHQISYDTIPTFYIGQLDQLKPPFQIDNGTVKTLLDSRNQVTPFREYLNSKPILPIVTFYYKINDRILVLGWCHNPVELKERKRGNKILQSEKHLYPERYNRLLSPQNGSIPVKRFSPQVLTHNRLIQRTAADYTDTYSLDSCTVSVVGLGSVGSFLASYLASAGIRSFWLVDSESLSVENIGRHLLGLKDVGRNKAESIADYLQWKNPLTKVHVCKRRIIQAIQSEPEFINQCDYHFICIGDFNTESWIASNMNRDEWNRPVFFIWVEPYLAGGHCLYLDKCDGAIWDQLFEDGKFIHNIISNKTHDEYSFMKQEAGCQTTFLPYSGSSLSLFLARLYPKLLEMMREGKKSKCFSWVGDLEFLTNKGIEIAEHINRESSFSIIERDIC